MKTGTMQTTFAPTHKWAGQPRCREYVAADGWRSYQCDKRATKEGNTKCGTHCEEAKAKRRAKSDARTAEWMRNWDAASRRRKAQQDVFDALRAALKEQAVTNDQNPMVTITVPHEVAVAATRDINSTK